MTLDDPNRPQGKKPPPFQDTGTYSSEFLRMHDELAKTMVDVVRRNERISNSMRSFLGYCFQAETDLRASECVMVQAPGQSPGSMTYWFQKRTEVETAGRRINALEAVLRSKEAEINMLMAELDHLKQKAGTPR